uniref:UBA domain-containing protein n=1 Tax=Davidia involucrata TaxID=16924 RepID=A0A5B7B965_DAVIN
MSPASKSKSKSKDKSSARAAKEQQKASSKLSGSTNTGNGSPASAYNPISGTFHTLDTAPVSSYPPLHNNGRFRNIEETDEHSGSSHGTAPEYDSLSNNGSCSGESEDHKEKTASTTPRQETIPGSDNDKREKIRQKNERKHQRQRERRAQELHERCSGYLMSRKLEVLSQQLMAMGFSSERATLALMLNEGRVEESVSWLFEGSEETQKKDLGSEANLKIDISEEIARIKVMEVTYKCSKQEVERAVIACEGDLEKAEETLKAQKPEPPVTPLQLEETDNPKHPIRPKEKPTVSVTIQQRKNERDPNYVRGATTVPESGNRNLQSLKTNQPKPLAEKRGPTMGSSSSVSYSMASPMQVAPSSAQMEVQHGVGGHEVRSIQQGTVREPVIMMQRPQSINIKQNLVSNVSASPPGAIGWYTNNALAVESMKSNGKLLHDQSTGSLGPGNLNSQHFYLQTQSTRSTGRENLTSQQSYPQTRYTQHPYMSSSVDPAAARMGGSWSTMGASSPSPSPSPSLTVPSSLGLFSGWGSTGSLGSNSQVDWSTGDQMSHCDYNSIDWTLESNSASSKRSGLMLGQSSSGLMLGLSSMRMAGVNGIRITGLQDGGVVTEATSSGGLREWTSPFAGKDIFSLPRQFVTSPSP